MHAYFGEGNGNPLQHSYLENPGDGGAWWAAICGVAQSRTRLKRLSSSIAQGFPGGSDDKESACNAGDPSSIPGLGRSPGEGYPLQYSCLQKSMDRGAWWATVHGVTKSQTRLSNQHTHRVHKLTYLPKVRNNHEVGSTLASENIDMTKLRVTDRLPPN